jgi:hypothetical protein
MHFTDDAQRRFFDLYQEIEKYVIDAKIVLIKIWAGGRTRGAA